MVGATDQLEASFPRGRPNTVGCSNAQSRGVLSVTGFRALERLGKKKRGLRFCGSLPKARSTTRRFASDGFIKVVKDGTVHFVRNSRTGRIVRSGPCGHWHCMEQPATDFGMARSDPPVQWLKLQLYRLRRYSCPQSLVYS